MLILRAQFHYFQKAGACIDVPVRQFYNFFHFPTPIEMEINGKRILTKPNACIFSKEEYELFEKEIKNITKETCKNLCSLVYNNASNEE